MKQTCKKTDVFESSLDVSRGERDYILDMLVQLSNLADGIEEEGIAEAIRTLVRSHRPPPGKRDSTSITH